MKLPGIVALLFASITAAVTSTPVVAHPGGLNFEGCHTNHKTGEYHCHRPQAPSSSARAYGIDPPAGMRPYRNCAEARAAGAAPIDRGQPGYAPHLDRDNDGIGCE